MGRSALLTLCINASTRCRWFGRRALASGLLVLLSGCTGGQLLGPIALSPFAGIDSVSGVTSTQVTIEYTPVSEGTAYLVQVFSADGTTSLRASTGVAGSTSATVTGLSPGTTYRAKARVIVENGMVALNDKLLTFTTPDTEIPEDYAGLLFWYDAADASTLFQDSTCSTPTTTALDPIGCWQDKSGNDRHLLQAAAPQQPRLSASTYNGRAAVEFTGTAQPLAASAPTALSGGLTYFVVYNYNSGGGADNALVELSDGGANRHFFIHRRYTSNTNFVFLSDQLSMGVVTHQSGSALYDVFENGSQLLDDATSAFGLANGTIADITVGDDVTGGNALVGEITEIIIYDREINTTEREVIEGYLACKWGTQVLLPGAHPYSSVCP